MLGHIAGSQKEMLSAELTAVEISATACRVASKKVQMVVDTIQE